MADWLLEAVHRQPQASGPPNLTTLGPISFTNLSFEEEISRDWQASFSCRPERLPTDVRAAMFDIAAIPLEVVLMEGSAVRFAGPVWSWGIQGGTLTVNCRGLGGYLRYMQVDDDTGDLIFDDVDQFDIVTGLIDAWQDLAYGDYGIDTSQIGSSGVNRRVTYLAAERHEVYRRIIELSERNNGFEWRVDPVSRELELGATLGADLSDSVHLDLRNITSGDEQASVAPGDIASEAFGVGTGPEDGVIVSQRANASLRETFGRVGISETFDGVSEQGTLDNYAQRMLDERSGMLAVPGPGLMPVRDADVGDYTAGDRVSYVYDAGLGVRQRMDRIARKRVQVDEGGGVQMAVEFTVDGS